MRISDWSSDVCFSDLAIDTADRAFRRPDPALQEIGARRDMLAHRLDLCILAPDTVQHLGRRRHMFRRQALHALDVERKRVVKGKSVQVRAELGGGGVIEKQKNRLYVTIMNMYN